MKRISWLLLLVLIVFGDLRLLASEYDAQRGQSPSGAVTFTTSGDRIKNVVWLEPADKPKERIELCSSNKYHVKIRFSPDERWLVLTTAMHEPLKNGIRLFKRGAGFTWTEVKREDIGGKVQTLILKESGEGKVKNFEGSLDAMCWSADSAAILLCAYGEAAAGQDILYVSRWFCVYEVATGKIGFDMAKYHFDLSLANLRSATNPHKEAR